MPPNICSQVCLSFSRSSTGSSLNVVIILRAVRHKKELIWKLYAPPGYHLPIKVLVCLKARTLESVQTMRKSEIVLRKEWLLSKASLQSKRSSCCTNPITFRLKSSLPFLISGYAGLFCKIKENSIRYLIILRSSANYFAKVRCGSNDNVAKLQWKLNIWRQLILTATGLQDELDEGNQRLLGRLCKVLQPLLAGVL